MAGGTDVNAASVGVGDAQACRLGSLAYRAWLGLAWLGLAWLGLAWLGLAWQADEASADLPTVLDMAHSFVSRVQAMHATRDKRLEGSVS